MKKNLSTYVQHEAQIHPSYLPGARDTDKGNRGIAYSGRPTASGPNIQNQPQEARRQFIPPDGMKFASLDWSQIEPRITAALSEDDNLAADIETGLYDAVANTLDCERKVAKMVVLLSAYLGSPKTLQDKLMLAGVNKSLKECKDLQVQMFLRYKDWGRWRETTIKFAGHYHYLCNPFGKRAAFIRPHPAKAVNFLPQSTAACILWYSLVQVEKAITPLGGEIAATVHDEILIQAPAAHIEQVALIAQGVMEQKWPQIDLNFHVPANIKIGDNWKDMFELDNPWRMYDV